MDKIFLKSFFGGFIETDILTNLQFQKAKYFFLIELKH